MSIDHLFSGKSFCYTWLQESTECHWYRCGPSDHPTPPPPPSPPSKIPQRVKLRIIKNIMPVMAAMIHTYQTSLQLARLRSSLQKTLCNQPWIALETVKMAEKKVCNNKRPVWIKVTSKHAHFVVVVILLTNLHKEPVAFLCVSFDAACYGIQSTTFVKQLKAVSVSGSRYLRMHHRMNWETCFQKPSSFSADLHLST